MKEYDLAVVIGRFQPFHNGHLHLIQSAKEIAEQVLVLVGSANSSRSIRNPWTFPERASMIDSACLKHPDRESWLYIMPLNDHFYDDEGWMEEVQECVSTFMRRRNKTVMVGHDKDSTSYYQKLFPQYDSINIDNHEGIDATNIRNIYFSGTAAYVNSIPFSTELKLENFKDFDWLQDEFKYIKQYKQSWLAAPYPVIFSTVDAVVVCSGHVLVIRRGEFPGKGLLALPGGFVEQDETLLNAAIRELKEETRLKMPIPAIKGVLRGQHVFDHPQRSMRGRTISNGFYFHLDPGKLPEVRGSDDAAEAFWMPLSTLRAKEFFEDHYHIIRYFV